MPTPRCSCSPVRYRFRTDAWPRISAEGEWPTIAQAAQAIGVAASTLGRALADQTHPGAPLMAAIGAALPRVRHEELYQLVRENACTCRKGEPRP